MNLLSKHDVLLKSMGVALLQLQSAEKVIRLCMTFVIPKDFSLSLEILYQQEDRERTKTLGYFLAKLRERALLEDSFDSLLKEFLNNRNCFIHDVSKIQGWGIQSPEQIAIAQQFVYQLIDQTEKVMKIFIGLTMAWQEQEGIQTSSPDHELFIEAERLYKPLASEYFFEPTAKSSG